MIGGDDTPRNVLTGQFPCYVPDTKDFSTTGTDDFSVSSGYAAQFARGIWTWLT
jgi:hypothetical protein